MVPPVSAALCLIAPPSVFPPLGPARPCQRCARCLRARLVAAAVRRRLPWLLLGLVFLGSALKDGDLVPETPMQNKRNVFNV